MDKERLAQILREAKMVETFLIFCLLLCGGGLLGVGLFYLIAELFGVEMDDDGFF